MFWKAVVFGVALVTLCGLVSAQDPEIAEVILPEVKPIGMSGSLNCTVIYQFENPVYWYHKGIHITTNDQVKIADSTNEIVNGLPKYQIAKYDIGGSGGKVTYRITVNRLERRDAGNYTCQIQILGSNKMVQKDGEMVVHIPPSIIKSGTTNTKTAEQGGPAHLMCKADGYPTPNITWTRVNGGVLPNGKLRVEGTSLKLDGLQAKDRGIYRCLADNAVRPPAVFDVTLLIKFRPVARAIQSSYGQAEGRQFDVTLECRISGWPEPELKWYYKSKGGELTHIQNSDKHTVNILLNHANILEQQERWFQLIIRTVQANDYGLYLCEGSNSLGTSQANITLFATSECQGPVCREEQRPEKNSATTHQMAPLALTTALCMILVAVFRTTIGTR